jgi:hypothetical protein
MSLALARGGIAPGPITTVTISAGDWRGAGVSCGGKASLVLIVGRLIDVFAEESLSIMPREWRI